MWLCYPVMDRLILRKLNEIAVQQRAHTQMLQALMCNTQMGSGDLTSNSNRPPAGCNLPLDSREQLQDIEKRLAQASFMESLVSDEGSRFVSMAVCGLVVL